MSEEFHHEEEKLGRITDWPLLRRLLGFLRPYWSRVAVGVVLLLVHSAVQVIIPLFYKLAVDKYIQPSETIGKELTWLAALFPPDPWAGLNYLAMAFLLLLTVGFLAAYGQAYTMLVTGQYVMYDLRMKLFAHLQRLDIGFFDRNPVGRLVTRVTNDVDQLNEMFTAGVHAVFGDILRIIGIVAVLLYLDWRLALLTMAIVPMIGLVSFVFRNYARRYHRRTRVTLARINAFLNEHLGGMTVVQLFNREKHAARQFAGINEDNRLAWRDAIFAHSVFYPAIEFLTTLATAFIITYGGGRVLSGSITLGDLTAFFFYARQFFDPIRDLADKYGILQTAFASSERIFRLLDEPVSIASPARPISLPERRGRVEFRNVWFAYKPGEWVLKDVSFTIERGEMAAIVGHTGAGKTTITNLLMRFYDIQQGEILLDGVDIRNLDLQPLRTRFAMVLQDPFLFSGTLASNVRLGTEGISAEQVHSAVETVNLSDLVSALPGGLDHEVRERGSTLSVGQKQLLSFARALAHDPEILILDEATSSVDTQTEHKIQQALERLIAGRTSIVIAHRLSTIQRADRILVFHKGQLREQGRHQDLLTQRGLYYKLYQLQYRDQEVAALADDD